MRLRHLNAELKHPENTKLNELQKRVLGGLDPCSFHFPGLGVVVTAATIANCFLRKFNNYISNDISNKQGLELLYLNVAFLINILLVNHSKGFFL